MSKVKITPEMLAQVEALAAYLTQNQIAAYFGMSRGSFRHLMANNDAVDVAYRKGRAKAVVVVGQTLLEQARAGNTTAMIFYLKCQGGWNEKGNDAQDDDDRDPNRDRDRTPPQIIEIVSGEIKN